MNTETCKCTLCGNPTPMLNTRLCDGCYELKHRIEAQPHLARKLTSSLGFAQLRESIQKKMEGIRIPLYQADQFEAGREAALEWVLEELTAVETLFVRVN